MGLGGRQASAALVDRVLYGAARKDASGAFSVATLTADGRDVRSLTLPGRGHDIAVCPVSRRCVVFARRPGTFAVAFQPEGDEPVCAIEAPADRHFYGHGVFSRDGQVLYTTENDFEAARGVIGIYDATDGFRRLGELSSYGVGPHDLALLTLSETLVVANGGLREHPDIGAGRRVLNLGSIETSLSYIDLRSGDLLEQHVIPSGAALSLRHLDVGRDDTVVLGGQLVDGESIAAGGDTRLLYRHRRQQVLTATELPVQTEAALAGYISSIAVDRSGQTAAVTSSKGSAVVIIEVASGRVLRSLVVEDVSGVAPSQVDDRFLATSGRGAVIAATRYEETITTGTSHQWDNHLVLVSR